MRKWFHEKVQGSEDSAAVGIRYALAVAIIGVALLIQYELEQFIAGSFPFITLYGAVAVIVWLCGWRPAAVSAFAGFFLVGVWFISPRITVFTNPTLAFAGFFSYVASCALIIWIGESMARQKRAAEERGARLEHELVIRRQVEESLRQRNEELDVIIDAMPAFVWTTDDASCTRAQGNSAVRELFGPAGPADVREVRLEDDAPPAEYFDRDGRMLAWEELPMQRAAATGQAVRDVMMQIRLRNGRKLWVVGNAAPVFNRDGQVRGVIAAFVDSTTQKEAEEAKERLRREAADRANELQTLLDSAPIAVWIAEDTRCARITGNAFADDMVMQAQRGSNVSRSAADAGVAYHVLRNGLALAPEELPAQVACSTARAVMNEELQLVFPDGRSVHLLMNAQPLFDADGQVRGAIATGADISRLKVAEAELRQAHRLIENRAAHFEQLVNDRTARLREMVSELEAFAFQLVHDLRAPLVSIQGFSRLLAENVRDPSEASYIRKIANSADKMDSFVHDVLRYSRLLQAPIEIEPVDLGAVLRSCIDSYASFQLPIAKVEMVGDFSIVQGNRSALVECITQILNNAVKFVAPDVMPHVRIWSDTRAGWTTFYFEDNGIGIPKSAHARVFEVFQRLNRETDGSGLGLTIVKKAVERMGGKMGVQSEAGQGCLFWIELKDALSASQSK